MTTQPQNSPETPKKPTPTPAKTTPPATDAAKTEENNQVTQLVKESKKYRQRAQTAEKKCEDLQKKIAFLETQQAGLIASIIDPQLAHMNIQGANIISAKTLEATGVNLQDLITNTGEIDLETLQVETEEVVSKLGLKSPQSKQILFAEGNDNGNNSTWSSSLKP